MKKLRKYIPLSILIAVYLVMAWQVFGKKPEPSALVLIMYVSICLLALGISALLIMDGVRLYKENGRKSKIVWSSVYALIPILYTALDTVQYLRYFDLMH